MNGPSVSTKRPPVRYRPAVAAVLNNLALLYQSFGDYGEAQSLFEQVLAIEEKAHGNQHPAVAKALSNLASLYYERGNFREAQALYEQAAGS